MPAYRERVIICPGESGQPVWIGEFPFWWDRRAFFERYGVRQIDTGSPFSVDYGLLLTAGEVMDWDRLCKGNFAHDPRSREPIYAEATRRWETMLGAASWVIVESYEWESGLG